MAREMKDSGTKWLGFIPEDWKLTQIGYVYAERRAKVSDTDYSPLSVTMKGVVPQLSTAAKTDAHDDRKLVCRNDFVINSRSDRRGSCGISALEGSVSLINTVLTPRVEMNPRYYSWLFHSTAFADEFYKWGHGIVDDLWTTGWQDMKKIIIPAPVLPEQESIAEHLDECCNAIDKIIEQTQQAIEEYKALKQAVITEAVTKGVRGDRPMKDSGVAWIGDIPEDWNVGKVKYSTIKIGSGKTPSGGAEVYLDSGVLFLRSQNIYDGRLLLDESTYISAEIDAEMANTRVEANDVLLNITGGSIGRTCVISEENLPANVNQHVCIVRVRQSMVLPKLMSYYWMSNIGKKAIALYQTGGNRAGMSADAIGNTPFLYYDNDEQQEIVTYLDAKCAEIDGLISAKQRLLAELESYKKSVIYEYVTGKKEAPVCP